MSIGGANVLPLYIYCHLINDLSVSKQVTFASSRLGCGIWRLVSHSVSTAERRAGRGVNCGSRFSHRIDTLFECRGEEDISVARVTHPWVIIEAALFIYLVPHTGPHCVWKTCCLTSNRASVGFYIKSCSHYLCSPDRGYQGHMWQRGDDIPARPCQRRRRSPRQHRDGHAQLPCSLGRPAARGSPHRHRRSEMCCLTLTGSVSCCQ